MHFFQQKSRDIEDIVTKIK